METEINSKTNFQVKGAEKNVVTDAFYFVLSYPTNLCLHVEKWSG
jgi:hypothetical protein